jgi:hypothetical protein
VVFILGEPGDADRFPFLPETLGRIAKKVGTNAKYRAGRCDVSRFNRFGSGDATSFAGSRSGRSFRHPASHMNDVRCDADTTRGPVLIDSYSEVGQRLVAAEGTVVGEFDVPVERRGSRVRIERRRHLSSVRVSVDAVLQRDGRQRDVREHQVKAAVAQDDHGQVSRRRDLWFRHRIDIQNPRATDRVRRRIQHLTVTGDELALRKHAIVDLRRCAQR